MELTTDNTAVVLDSTSDYPEAPTRFPNMRFVPLYVRFGDDTYRDHGSRRRVLRSVLARHVMTSQPTLQDSVAAYEELAAYSDYSRTVVEGVGDVPERRAGCRQVGGDQSHHRHADGVALRSRCFPRDPAPARPRDDGRRSVLSTGSADNRVLFTVETLEYLQRGGRIGRAAAVAGSLLNVRPILSVDDGVVVAVARVRGRQKAIAEIERRFVSDTTDGPGLRVAIAHANAPEWVGTLSELVWRVRPNAEIEFTSTLGAVVGTHAGPGAVGFFWFQDD
jgi:fatty acid-binding protein DegV